MAGVAWLACWFVASAVTRGKFATASFALRAVDPRTRAMRIRNIVLAAPLTATVFNVMLMTVLARPIKDADAEGVLGADAFVYSRESAALGGYYVDFCAFAAFAALAAGFLYMTFGVPAVVGPRELGTAVAISFGAWAACAVLASAVLLRSTGSSPRVVLGVMTFLVVSTVLTGGGLFAMSAAPAQKARKAQQAERAGKADDGAGGGGPAERSPPVPRNLAYGLVAVGALLLAGVVTHGPLVAGSGAGLASALFLLGGAVSLVADAASDPGFLSDRRDGTGGGDNAGSRTGDAAAIVVMIFAFGCCGAAVWLSFLKA
jgi:hypothetical protein